MDEQVAPVVRGSLAVPPLSIPVHPPPPVQDGRGQHRTLRPSHPGSLVWKLARGMLGAQDVAQAHGCVERERKKKKERERSMEKVMVMLFKNNNNTSSNMAIRETRVC